MTATTARPLPPPDAPGLRAVSCLRCGEGARPLCEVKPGEIWIKHQDGYRVISGLGPHAVMWAKCGRCGLQQPVDLSPAAD